MAELDEALGPVRRRHPELRWSPPDRWHVTLRFHGGAEPGEQLAGLAALPAPTLRLAGTGRFPNVLWVGVTGPLEPLARAAGAGADWRPHLTVARWRGRVRPPEPAFTGREWTVTEVALVRSHPAEGYTLLDRVRLATPFG